MRILSSFRVRSLPVVSSACVERALCGVRGIQCARPRLQTLRKAFSTSNRIGLLQWRFSDRESPTEVPSLAFASALLDLYYHVFLIPFSLLPRNNFKRASSLYLHSDVPLKRGSNFVIFASSSRAFRSRHHGALDAARFAAIATFARVASTVIPMRSDAIFRTILMLFSIPLVFQFYWLKKNFSVNFIIDTFSSRMSAKRSEAALRLPAKIE